jgi:nucleoside-diphosphate-sugar epimerase
VNILVVGAAGFIGRHLVQRLVESDHDVTPCGTDPAMLQRLFPGARCIAGEYGRDSAEVWVSRLAGVDVVIKWLHPFGPVTKNVPLALATLVMMALED